MSAISQATIEKVRECSDFASIVGEYVRLESAGSELRGLCPFHNEKTPSFYVNPEKKVFHCYGCGKGGGIFDFVKEMEKVDFPDAVEFLAQKCGVQVVYADGFSAEKNDGLKKKTLFDLYSRVAALFNYFLTQRKEGAAALQYARSRGISDEMIEKFRLGFSHPDRRWLKKFLRTKNYSDEFLSRSGLFSQKYPDTSFFSGRLMFPIFDKNGQAVAFGGRVVPPEESDRKYYNSGDSEIFKKGEILYALNLAKDEIRRTKSVVLCEGYFDVIAYHQAGICNAVAPLGTAFTESHAKILRRFADTAILSFDTDGAGMSACYKSILLCRSLGFEVKVVEVEKFVKSNSLSLKDGKIPKDPAEILQNFGKDILTKIVFSAISDAKFLLTSFFKSKGWDLATMDGRARASVDFFKYADSLQNDIQKEAALRELSGAFGISFEAVRHDFFDRRRLEGAAEREAQKQGSPAPSFVKKNAELRAMLQIAANPQFFSSFRNAVDARDFKDENARQIFLLMEDLFRSDSLSCEKIAENCGANELKALICEAVVSAGAERGEDSEKRAERLKKIVSDAVLLLRRNHIAMQREQVMFKIRQSVDEVETASLLEEKKLLDEDLKSLESN